jgi:hypothetical protein
MKVRKVTFSTNFLTYDPDGRETGPRAFFEEHRRCGELDGGVDGALVWIKCDCGGQIAHVVQPQPMTNG